MNDLANIGKSANYLHLTKFEFPAFTVFQLCLLVLHTLTTIIVFATFPMHRVWVLFYSFAIASLTKGWRAFVLVHSQDLLHG